MMRIIKFIPFLLLGLMSLAMPAASHAQVSVGVSIRVGPPPLPVYVQPICPGPGYLWTPGYWAYGPEGYYWVPGTWVEPPEVGVLWTPGYWGWRNGFYVWHGGYWGPHVGFYGGINYGFGYTGVGFAGGYWRGRSFYYNRAVTNVNVVNIHNTYHTTVINRTTINRVSFNGGAGGTRARATFAEQHAEREHHFEATPAQNQHQHFASTNHEQLASINHGHPNVAASPKPGVYSGNGVVSGNHNSNFQKFSRNNTTPAGGNSSNSTTFARRGNGLQNNGAQGSGPQGGSKVTSNNTVATHGNITHNTGNGDAVKGNHATFSERKTYHNDAAVHQNSGAQNNVRVNNAHVNNNAHVHGQNGGQHGEVHERHPNKH